MTIPATSVERASHGLAVTRVVAVSTRKVRGRAAARIELEVALEAALPKQRKTLGDVSIMRRLAT